MFAICTLLEAAPHASQTSDRISNITFIPCKVTIKFIHFGKDNMRNLSFRPHAYLLEVNLNYLL